MKALVSPVSTFLLTLVLSALCVSAKEWAAASSSKDSFFSSAANRKSFRDGLEHPPSQGSSSQPILSAPTFNINTTLSSKPKTRGPLFNDATSAVFTATSPGAYQRFDWQSGQYSLNFLLLGGEGGMPFPCPSPSPDRRVGLFHTLPHSEWTPGSYIDFMTGNRGTAGDSLSFNGAGRGCANPSFCSSGGEYSIVKDHLGAFLLPLSFPFFLHHP